MRRAVLVCAASLAMTSACGQKGALYLPPQTGTVVTRPATANSPDAQGTGSPAQNSPSPAGPAPTGATAGKDTDKKNRDSTQPPK